MTLFSKKKILSQKGVDLTSVNSRITVLENNEYKVTYYEIISGTSGSLTIPSQATINAGEFGLSGNAILSKINGSNKPTFESPTTSGGAIVTASLTTSTGAWVASGTYTDTNVALIYSIKIKAVYYSNLTYSNIIETVNLEKYNFTDITSLCTLVGWSSYTTNSIRSVDMGDYYIVTGYITGTSNSATTTVQLPYTNNGHRQADCGYGVNNGTSLFTRIILNGASGTIDFRTAAGGNTWTNSGTKEIDFCLIVEK